jgi:hypothetical protein
MDILYIRKCAIWKVKMQLSSVEKSDRGMERHKGKEELAVYYYYTYV